MFSICFVALALIVWFKTNAFVEYAELVGLRDWLVLQNFRTISDDIPELTFVDFLAQNYSGFFIRLLTCPICCSVWLGFLWPPTFTVNAVGGLLLYLIVSKLL